MPKVNKLMLMPIATTIAGFVKTAYGYEIQDDQLNLYVDLALISFSVVGYLIPFFKKDVKNTVETEDEDIGAFYH